LTLEGKHGAWSLIMPGAPRRKLIMAKSVTRKQKRSKYSVRLGAAMNVIEAYAEVPECVREVFRRFLAFYCEDVFVSSFLRRDRRFSRAVHDGRTLQATPV
jgi:hypothetical protein